MAVIKEKGDFIYVGGKSRTDPSTALVYKMNKVSFEVIWIWQYNTTDDSDNNDEVKDLDIDSQGNVWASLFSWPFYNRLIKISNTGQTLFMKRVRSFSGAASEKAVVRVNSNDEVYFVSDRNTYTIEKFNSDGLSLWLREFPTGRSATVRDATMDADGNMIVLATEYVTLSDQLTLTKYNSNGDVVFNQQLGERTDGGENYPAAVFKKDNYIYSFGSDRFNKTFVRKTNDSGTLQWVYKFAESAVPFSYAVDSKGNSLFLYFKEPGMHVRKVSANGSLIFEKEVAYSYFLDTTTAGIFVDDSDYIYVGLNALVVKISPSGSLVFSERGDWIPEVTSGLFLPGNQLLITGNYDRSSCGVVKVVSPEHRKTQTITGTPGAVNGKYGFTSALTGTSDSALPLSYVVDDENILIIDNGLIQFKEVGETQITLSQTGNEEFIPAASVIIPVTVTKADLHFIAAKTTKVFGEDNPALSYSISGFVNGEAESDLDELPGLATAAEKFSNAGAYELSLNGGIDNHYDFVFESSTLTILKAPLQFIPDDKIKTYGEPNPTMTFNVTGFVNGDDLTDLDRLPDFKAVADTFSNTGEYPISGSGGRDNNYDFVFEAGTLTINKAIIKVSANDRSKAYGEVNPELLYLMENFAGDDSETDIDVLPEISTNAELLSNAGVYDIVCGGGSDNNYNFEYAPGSLTVNKASQQISFPEIFGQLLVDNTFILSASASSGLPISFVTGSTSIEIDGNTVRLIDSGDAEISATQSGNENFLPAEPVVRKFNVALITGTEQKLNPFQVYPNPVLNKIIVETNEESAKMVLLNLSGVILENRSLNKGINQVDLSSYAAGIYFLKFSSKRQGIVYSKIEKIE
jgi:hypothetical protein